ncbi:YceH family protein [Marinobacterium arenosum]|uniref:YceH family protein n=1 Tax=Marinobacterium arenosum TaxID=2862496 RepID=UPI001C95C7C4|nr:DUF480 domain-containing protein [Marinobacterium arenosum]MBY4675884.1 DUF480 domain-containing protein [Marinobacterium arenosum]
MDMNLSLYETRVIGALLEKERTTPDQYPLTLNALTTACNQKSNREPVLELAETEVREVLDGLLKKHLVSELEGFGSRVTKFKHRFCNTEFSDLKLSDRAVAVLCVLFLRGPQTPGELRSRTNRLCSFDDVHQVEATLEKLISHDHGPLVVKLPREPGKRECRYAHLFSGEVEHTPAAMPSSAAGGSLDQEERIAELEQQVAEMRQQIADLQQLLDELLS